MRKKAIQLSFILIFYGADITTYTNPWSLTVHILPLGLQQPQGVHWVQPQSIITAALPLHPENGWITVPTHLGGQLRTITGQQPVQLQLVHVSAKEVKHLNKKHLIASVLAHHLKLFAGSSRTR